jgi:hypothetical protein
VNDPEMQDDYPSFDEARVEEAFRDGLRTAREYMARFVEQGGDTQTAVSIRANWNPVWGKDDGPLTGSLWIGPWGVDEELHNRCRANLERALAEAYRDSDGSGEADETHSGSAVGDSAGRETASPENPSLARGTQQ